MISQLHLERFTAFDDLTIDFSRAWCEFLSRHRSSEKSVKSVEHRFELNFDRKVFCWEINNDLS